MGPPLTTNFITAGLKRVQNRPQTEIGKKRKMEESTANAHYNENYTNFLSFLTKQKDVNYKMRRARG